MDFIFGILLVFIIIYILINFVSITVSNKQFNDRNNSDNSYTMGGLGGLFSTPFQKDNKDLVYNYKTHTPRHTKLQSNSQTYDYNKYFFM